MTETEFKVGDKVQLHGIAYKIIAITNGVARCHQARRNYYFSYREDTPVANLVAHVSKPKISPNAKACQICGNFFLAQHGKVAHHGYRRPLRGSGVQTASCIGAQELPFEVSRDVLGNHIAQQQNYLDRTREDLEKALTNPGTMFKSVPALDKDGKQLRYVNPFTNSNEPQMRRVEVQPGEPDYAGLLRDHIAKLQREEKDTIEYIAFQTERYDGWKPAKPVA